MDLRPLRRRAAILAAGLCLLTSALSHPARADEPTAADRETARTLMEEGRALRDQKDLKGALDRFQRADAIMHVPSTGYELAETQVGLGLLVEAKDTLAHIRAIPAAPNEPRPFREARRRADELDGSLAGRIPGLTITVTGAPPGVTPSVTIDGAPVPAAVLGVPRRVDPGHHVLVATVDGGEGREEADVAESETRPVTIAITMTTPSAPAPAEVAAPPPPPRSHTLTYASIALGGVGVAGLGVGAVTGILTLSKKSSLSTECGASHQCPPSAFGDLDSAHTTATISTAAFVAGGVCLAAGVTGFFLTRKGASSGDDHAEVTPWIGPGGAGLSGRF
jgi:hypothetical protein